MTKDDAVNAMSTSKRESVSPRISTAPADPGVFVVDDFLTEEQEAEILNQLDLTVSWEC